MLREGEQLDADSTCTVGKSELGEEELLLLYRAFLPFNGDALKARQFFAAFPGNGRVADCCDRVAGWRAREPRSR